VQEPTFQCWRGQLAQIIQMIRKGVCVLLMCVVHVQCVPTHTWKLLVCYWCVLCVLTHVLFVLYMYWHTHRQFGSTLESFTSDTKLLNQCIRQLPMQHGEIKF
jgi:hypothetical protein